MSKSRTAPAPAPVSRCPEPNRELLVSIEGQSVFASPKTFQTGSVGWNINGKVLIDGRRCQVSGNITVIGSKPGSKAGKSQFDQDVGSDDE
jgi:hypothetical protein